MLGATPLLAIFWRDVVATDALVNEDVLLVYAVLSGVLILAR